MKICAALALVSLALLAACGGEPGTAPESVAPAPPESAGTGFVRVDHILIGVEGAPRMERGDPLEEARTKAYDLLEKLKAGADWDALKAEHTDDGPPARPPGGPYVLTESDAPARSRAYFPRKNMAKSFGDAAYSLDIGEMTIADYDKDDSPFGFHIVKRLPLGPAYVTVDHILIGVEGAPRMKSGDPLDVARKKAYDLVEELEGGADWAALKKEHSDDPPPGGPYTMSNFGEPRTAAQEIPREQMATAFGDVSFDLEVGEIGVADHDRRKSPFGFHIIKRLK